MISGTRFINQFCTSTMYVSGSFKVDGYLLRILWMMRSIRCCETPRQCYWDGARQSLWRRPYQDLGLETAVQSQTSILSLSSRQPDTQCVVLPCHASERTHVHSCIMDATHVPEWFFVTFIAFKNRENEVSFSTDDSARKHYNGTAFVRVILPGVSEPLPILQGPIEILFGPSKSRSAFTRTKNWDSNWPFKVKVWIM